LTKGSGDQGIDIIATKDGVVVVLQCKRYSGSVGNKAVQEVLGGKEMIKANHAAVVTNSTYTKSARQLAANSGVMLIHFDQLNMLDKFVVAAREQ
jgi:restriction system protein